MTEKQASPGTTDAVNATSGTRTQFGTLLKQSASQGQRKKRQNVASLIVELLEGAEFFHTPDGTPHIAAPLTSHTEVWRIDDDQFGDFVSKLVYEQIGRPPTASALTEALAVLRCTARFDGPTHEVHLRVAGDSTAIYLDLANEMREVVEITADGCRILTEPPIRFRRAKGMLPLPQPVFPGSLDPLRSLLNLENESQWALVLAWLLGGLQPRGPYPVLSLTGEHGSRKSTMQRMVRNSIDPHISDVAAPPKTIDDLVVAASHTHIVSFDNLSSIDRKTADAICRLSTGGALSKRKLYTDRDVEHISVQRPVVLNGITQVATQSDLLDRAIVLDLAPISKRRPESELWREFEAARPEVLGALCTAVSTALRRRGSFELLHPPRMADLAAWVCAAEPALGLDRWTFLEAYEKNREDSRRIAIEDSPVANVLWLCLQTCSSWQGTMAQLLAALEASPFAPHTKPRSWPRSPRGLANVVRRFAPDFRALGWEVTLGQRRPGGNRDRLVRFERRAQGTPDAQEAQ